MCWAISVRVKLPFSVAGIPIWVLVVLGFLLAVGCIFYIRIFQPDCWPKENLNQKIWLDNMDNLHFTLY